MRVPKVPYRDHGNWPGTGVAAQNYGPQLAFAAATVAGFAAWAACGAMLPAGFAAPIVTSVFLVMAALLGFVAWFCRYEDPGNVTYRDVAGALTLIGLCASVTIDPDQLLRLANGGAASSSHD